MNSDFKKSLSLKKITNRLKFVDVENPSMEMFVSMISQLCDTILLTPKCGCEKILCAVCKRQTLQVELSLKLKRIIVEFNKYQ
jgi:hypothetical protein